MATFRYLVHGEMSSTESIHSALQVEVLWRNAE